MRLYDVAEREKYSRKNQISGLQGLVIDICLTTEGQEGTFCHSRNTRNHDYAGALLYLHICC